MGYVASLPLQDRLIRHTDDVIQSQVLGLHMNGMMLWQAVGALIAGAVASLLPPAAAMGTMAAASTAVTLLLVPGLRRSAPTVETACTPAQNARWQAGIWSASVAVSPDLCGYREDRDDA